MGLDATTLGIVATLAPVAGYSVWRRLRRQRAARAALLRARAHGLDEPPSLHPIIDPSRCVGCGSCIAACPEGDVLLLVDGRSRLVNAAHCVGHGLCKAACPNDAIELVFGTAKRGLQLPEVDGEYRSNVPGVYIAGELGGMGLIRNAILQGTHAVAAIARELEQERAAQKAGVRNPVDPALVSATELHDVAIVGAGPAGIAAALACRERGLRHVLLDQDGLGGSVNHYPRRKLVMTSPVELPLVGRMHFREVSKEDLLEFWTGVVRKARLEVLAPQRVTAVRRGDGGAFEVVTERAVHRARRVVLAIGRRGTPRKLGVPGEDSPKVAYRLLEPERWAGQRVLVVGGGNSAIEAAVSLAAAGATTTLSYRGSSFNRVAQANLDRLEAAARNAGLEVLLGSQLRCIEPEQVHLETAGGVRRIDNDQVFVFAGGELPTAFLDRIGVAMRWHHGERRTGAPRETACSVQARTAPPAAGGAGQGGAA